MGIRLAIAFALVSVLTLTSVQAENVDAEPSAADEVLADSACSAPPCGYIVPILDMEFEEKQPCGGGLIIYAEGPPEDCDPIMMDGESQQYDGVVRWYWEVSEDGTYPKEAGKDIEITFSSTGLNPDWIDVQIEPSTFIITDADLVHPDHLDTEREDGKVYFWYEREITATFTRDGSPDKDDLQRIESREGVIPFFLKAKSSESGPRFRESFGVEEFRWLTCNDMDIANRVKACPDLDEEGNVLSAQDEEAPGLPLLGALGALGLVAVAARRRR